MFTDKYNLSSIDEQLVVEKNLTQLIYTTGKFENLPTTLPQTDAIVHNYEVNGVRPEDITTILNLKRGYQYLLDNQDSVMRFADIKIINKIIKGGTAYAGDLRSMDVQVPLTNDVWVPPIPNEQTITIMTKLLESNQTATEKALELNLMLSRNQLFMDGNKRTALVAANLLMVQSGTGFLAIPESKMHWYGSQLAKYYRTNRMDSIKQWLYDNCIFGIDKS